LGGGSVELKGGGFNRFFSHVKRRVGESFINFPKVGVGGIF